MTPLQETDHPPRSPLGAWAYAHAERLLTIIGPRGSTTPQERQAADYVEAELRRLGLGPVQIEDFVAPTSAWRPFAACLSLALLGKWLSSQAYRAQPRPGFRLGGASLGLLGTYWALQEIDLNPTWLRHLLPSGPSRNVWARIPATAQAKQRVVFLGHLDSHRSPWIFQTPARVELFSRIIRLGFASLAFSLVLLLLRLARPTVPRWLFGLPIAAETGALLLCLDADRSPFSPGANDNAAAVGAVLALARHLAAQPLATTEVWVLCTGCEEVGCYGIRHFLSCHRAELQRIPTYFIDYELPGIGDLAYVVDEGLLIRHRYSAVLRALAEQIGHEIPDLAARPHRAGAYGESVSIHKAGYETITLNCLGPGGAAPYWHQLADTADKLQPTALDRACRFGLELAQRLDSLPPNPLR